MVELLAAIGLGAKELFAYNRESYKFDQDQRLEREVLRLEMQVKRFELFREDVRDLVELTVGRMDVYHLVGALFLEFCVTFFCEGRVQANAPPFILALFLLSNACAFVYLLLAVWLSMHASIASHSFGVRLLTRFVRLPIPSPSQISCLSRRLADFERQGLENVLRLPVLHESNAWQSVEAASNAKEQEQAGDATPGAPLANSAANSTAGPARSVSAPCALSPPVPGAPVAGRAFPAAKAVAAPPSEETEEAARRDPLGNGEVPFCGEEAMLRPAALPGLHVQLFRRLQAKWQCYDAYCRVCMALGVNQILQGLTYYAIVHTLVENRSPSCGYALIVIFQAAALAVAVLDISGLRRRALLAVQAVGTLPAFLAALAVHSAERNETGGIEPGEVYYTAPAMFFLQATWLELLLWVAQPSQDNAALPRRFRTVLFLDVFGDGVDPTDAEIRPNLTTTAWSGEEELRAERFAGAEAALGVAVSAVRRWEVAPRVVMSDLQQAELSRLRVELQIWRRALKGELAWRAAARGVPHEADLVAEDSIRPWGELSSEQEDPFEGCLIGPFEHDMGYEASTYFFDPEKITYVWESPGSRPVLSLAAASAAIRGLEAAMRLLLAMSETVAEEEVETRQQDDLDFMLRGVLAVPRRIWHFFQTRLAAARVVAADAAGIELSEPLVQRQNSGGSDSGPSIAGPHAKHFVPERLPWQVLRNVTRVLQFAWCFTGSMAVLRELGIYRIDFQQHPGKERRLTPAPRCEVEAKLSLSGALEQINFQELEVSWPHGSFFEAEVISWLETEEPSSSSGDSGALLLGSSFANYRGHPGARPLQLEELSAHLSPGVVAINAGGGVRFLASKEAMLWFWPFHEASSHCRGADVGRSLGVSGNAPPWRSMSGAVLPCGMLGPSEAWCLALAGWDGSRLLMASAAMEDLCTLPSEPVRPRYAVPLQEGPSPVALSLTRRGPRLQLLCLFADATMQAWDLLQKKALWRARAAWPTDLGDFQARSLAEDVAKSEVYIVGFGRTNGSRLLKARLLTGPGAG
ncbi:unnamed protein product [Effrenium voratum]|uniref:Uncharacterized protein n=1 Tax=Effrenium voratum TaxID=2562239 RepID=A0AA36IZN1_9DINO|nr:unnamed protein product [Effrenium voratum]